MICRRGKGRRGSLGISARSVGSSILFAILSFSLPPGTLSAEEPTRIQIKGVVPDYREIAREELGHEYNFTRSDIESFTVPIDLFKPTHR